MLMVVELEQAKLFGPVDCVPSLVHVQLAIDALQMGSDRASGNIKLFRDLRVGQAGRQEPKDVQLPFAEGFGQGLHKRWLPMGLGG